MGTVLVPLSGFSYLNDSMDIDDLCINVLVPLSGFSYLNYEMEYST